MKTSGYFSWDSSLMEIISAEERISKSTEKPYMVVKARMVFKSNPQHLAHLARAKKVYTMLCFSESLFQLFEAGNYHTFEGELSFDWGNTWMKITRLYDDEGNRLLRSLKTENDNAFDEKIAGIGGKNIETCVTATIKRTQDGDEPPYCDKACEVCLDYDTSYCPLY